MSNALDLERARHNEEIAQFIFESKKSIHWTIIVSFYSALRYIRAKIFPLTDVQGGVTITYNTFDDYCSRNSSDKINKHDRLLDLAWKQLPQIGGKYQWLFHYSITARYNNDVYDDRYSEKAIKLLKEIKKVCQ